AAAAFRSPHCARRARQGHHRRGYASVSSKPSWNPVSGDSSIGSLGHDRIEGLVILRMRNFRHPLALVSEADRSNRGARAQLRQSAIVEAAAIAQAISRLVEVEQRHQ